MPDNGYRPYPNSNGPQNFPNMPGYPAPPQYPGTPYPPLRLAHAYVPWQHLGQIFSPAEGLAHGTIFPELVSPYPG